MRATRMYGYKQPLVLEEIETPNISLTQVLVRVGGAGMCRSDVQLIDGYFQDAIKPTFPITPGHEIAGSVEAIGSNVPETAKLAVGDQVVVAAGWGDGICRQCRLGNEQICEHGSWPGFGPPGGYAEFVAVPYRQLIRLEKRMKWEELAPLDRCGSNTIPRDQEAACSRCAGTGSSDGCLWSKRTRQLRSAIRQVVVLGRYRCGVRSK